MACSVILMGLMGTEAEKPCRASCPKGVDVITDEFVLLADADEEHVEKVRSGIKEEDDAVAVVVAHDGKEALDAALGVGMFARDGLGNKPLFVLVDLTLPKLNAHVVLQLFRTITRNKKVPLIAMASSQDETLLSESATIGATEVIPKPVSKNTLKTLLRKYRRSAPKRRGVYVFEAIN